MKKAVSTGKSKVTNSPGLICEKCSHELKPIKPGEFYCAHCGLEWAANTPSGELICKGYRLTT